MNNCNQITIIVATSLLCLSLASRSFAEITNKTDNSETLNFEVTNCSELQNISQADGHYQLTNDIDCTGTIFSPLEFSSQTNSNEPFTGVFDGNNFSITNLELSANSSKIALFSTSYAAEFKNLTLENVTAIANPSYENSKAAALVANSNATNFSNILVRNADIKANEMGAISAYSDVDNATTLDNLHVRNSRFTLVAIPSSGYYSDSKVGGVVWLFGRA